MHTFYQSTIAFSAAFLSTLPNEPARAQDYPTKPVHIISGFGAGSAGDVLVRLLVPKLTQSMGQQFIVEYKPGAGSNIAAEFVVRAPADGYILFLGTSANTINATFSPNLSFDFAKDLVPIAQLGSVPNLFVVNPSLGVTNLREFITLAKSQPGQINYATPGVGTLSHMSGELLNFLAGIKLVHVPTRAARRR
jgi:tripartite-type tricarboxylate transporter receptor subunit TctC